MNSSIYGYLTVFHAIVREGSIARAARKLEIAPPSVSQALKLLEQHIGLPLFNRTTRKIELTEAGQRLYENTHAAMQTLEFAVEEVQDLGNIPSGLVRITVARFAYLSIIQPHLGEFCERYPDIQLEISINDGTVDILKEGFDLGIRYGDRVEENMVARQLLPPVTQGLFASRSYLARYGEPKKPTDLQQHKLIGWRFTTSNRLSPLTVQDKGQEIQVEMPMPLIVNNIDTANDAVRQGVGIGRVFLPVLEKQADKADFIPVMEKYWISYPPVYLYYLQNSQKAGRVRALIEFLIEKTEAS